MKYVLRENIYLNIYSPMPSKRKPRPVTPGEILITRGPEVISAVSQIDDNGRLFVICPRCEKHVQLSRYGHPGNFQEHYMSKKCDLALKRKTRKEFKKTLLEKLGPAYDPALFRHERAINYPQIYPQSWILPDPAPAQPHPTSTLHDSESDLGQSSSEVRPESVGSAAHDHL
ncbi:hypothetical protein C8Q76DRAFT_851510 [Earliella scabrosa]|nr:hypothetical protein C8Q76DRAFT_851510 [Earliella scabrosa]